MTLTADSLPEHLTTTQAATYLNWSRDSVLRAIEAGDLNAIRWGRLVRIPRTDLEEFIASLATGDQLARRRRSRRGRRPA